MNWHRLILTVGTKLPIATVGPPITLMIDDIFAPTTLGRDPPRLVAMRLSRLIYFCLEVSSR